MTHRIQLEPAYVLSRRPYRETSALLEIFSETQGRVGLVARGAQSSRSRLRGLLESFKPLLLSWNERGELGSLTGAEGAPQPSRPLSGEAVFCGWYVNELLLRMITRHDPHPALFTLYRQTLSALSAGEGERALRVFEKQLLSELGYGLLLPPELDPTLTYRYDWDEGPMPSEQGYRGESLLALAGEDLRSAEQLRDAKHLLRDALARHGAGADLKTPKLLREMRATLESHV
ncbi:MAG: DNA repair protein RecO [Pseudomonadota bacterium]